jgi:hypothetical protein
MLPKTTTASAPSSTADNTPWPRGSRRAIRGAKKMPAARYAVATTKIAN